MGPWPTEEVERALRLMQGFDPIGVAARDLQECLLLQLRHEGHAGTPAERIVTEYMRLLQNHQVPELARKLGMSIEDLKPHIEIIRHLDPKPGSRLNPSQSQYVIPDVYIVKVEDRFGIGLRSSGSILLYSHQEIFGLAKAAKKKFVARPKRHLISVTSDDVGRLTVIEWGQPDLKLPVRCHRCVSDLTAIP